MADTTEETWTIGGLNLTTYAHGIEVVDEGTSQLRGSNRSKAYRNGSFWRRKYRGSRVMGLNMWVTDYNADGVLPTTDEGRRAQLNDNIAALNAILNESRSILTVERKVRRGSGLVEMSAEGEFANATTFVRNQNGLGVARLSADLILPDPYFYGETIFNTPASTDFTIVNPGDLETARVEFRLFGPLDSPTITNVTTGSTITVPNANVPSSQAVFLFCYEGTARRTFPPPEDITATVTHEGDPLWMPVPPGSNQFTLTDTNSGSMSVYINPAYL